MPILDPILPNDHEPLVKWGKLYGAAPALCIAEAARDATGPIIVIAQSSREAETLSDEIGFFAGPTLSVKVFPDLETLPFDSFSAHPDITSARLATLATSSTSWVATMMQAPAAARARITDTNRSLLG